MNCNQQADQNAPMHPGSILEQHFMKPNKINQTDLALVLGVADSTVSRLIKGKSALSIDLAIRLEKVFGVPAVNWMSWQAEYDLHGKRSESKYSDLMLWTQNNTFPFIRTH